MGPWVPIAWVLLGTLGIPTERGGAPALETDQDIPIAWVFLWLVAQRGVHSGGPGQGPLKGPIKGNLSVFFWICRSTFCAFFVGI